MSEANAFAVKTVRFPVWRIIENGGMSGIKSLASLELANISTGLWTRNALESNEFVSSHKRESIKLTRCAVRDLGFNREPKIKQVWSIIEEVGGLCPVDLGPNLRLQLMNQPFEDRFFVAMNTLPMSPDNNNRGIFYLCCKRDVRKKKELWLETCAIDENAPIGLRNEIVFVLK